MRFFKQKCPKTRTNIAYLPSKRAYFDEKPRFGCIFIGAGATAVALLLAAPAAAQQQPEVKSWWITPGAVSYHFKNQDQFNQTHPGLGVEYHFAPDWAAVGGTYKNSNNLWSKYVGVNWTPAALRLGPARLGATAQIADNYKAARDGKPFAFAAPLIAFEGERFGANIYIIPTIRNVTGAVALQFKFAL
ncbi:MAG: hypothetical protein RL341_145 [Pseudomonadota bacterium]|jgi:hypothetical protein